MMLGVAVVAMVACGSKADGGASEQSAMYESMETTVDTLAATADGGVSEQSAMDESMETTVDTLAATAYVMPKVIDFYATWCGPCQKIAPIIEELAKEYEGKVIFEKVDVDEKQELALEYGVEAIPTLVFMKADGTYDKSVGFMDKEALKAEIAKLLE